MAGYSGTPLPKKLGIKAGHSVVLLDAPAGFVLDDLPDGVVVHGTPPPGPVDVFVAFARDSEALARHWSAARPAMKDTGSLWVAFVKQAAVKRLHKATGFTTDVNDAVVRAFGLARGLVDTKVCAIDDDWSGLRFMVRLVDRR